MDEVHWLKCIDPQPMLEFLLRKHGVAEMEMQRVAAAAMRRRKGWERKFRLYACAWCRQFENEISDERLRVALETVERYADGTLSDKEFRSAKRRATAAFDQLMANNGPDGWSTAVASVIVEVMSLRFLPGWNPHRDRESGTRNAEAERRTQELMRVQSSLLHDLFGNPFRPVTVDPSWLAWNNGTVVSFACDIFDNLAFDLMPVLADALEDAGCTEATILDHLRGPGPHVRGCWAVDLITGKS